MSSSESLRKNDLPAVHGGRPLFSQRFRFIKPTLPALEDVLKNYRVAYDNGVITECRPGRQVRSRRRRTAAGQARHRRVQLHQRLDDDGTSLRPYW